MEIHISNSKVSSVSFPKRKNQNVTEKNWDSSKDNRIVLEKKQVYIDGKDGEVKVDYKVPPHIMKDIANGKIDLNGTYFTEDADHEIETLLDIALEQKYAQATSESHRKVLMLLDGTLKL